MALTQADIARVKALGFLRNRGTELFSGRIVPTGTVFSAWELIATAEIAARFGNGKVIPTVRMTLELPGHMKASTLSLLSRVLQTTPEWCYS